MMKKAEKPLDSKKIKLIWMGMLASIFIYGGAGYVYLTQIPVNSVRLSPDVLAKLRLALYLVSLVFLFTSIKFSRKAHSMFAPTLSQQPFQGIEFTEINPASSPPGVSDKLTTAFPMLIISWALSEAIAIFGLILTFEGGRLPDLLGFSLAALFLMIINRPKIPTTPPGTFSSITPG